ncbi:MAG: ABC transporter ATP-binding protein [Planctomycetes bacterium]|nr:ABC transporter ATP-binding protein [Planctomycetota bacterium]
MTEVFQAKGLVKRFRRTHALDGFDLRLEPGQVTVLLGANGAGKSTLLRLALGVLRPNAGELTVLGMDPLRKPDAIRERTGYVPDTPDAPPWMTIGELCRFSRAHYPSWNEELVDSLIESLDVPRTTRLGQMSRGQGMKAMLVLALAHEPELLLLDEPFGGLDPLVREDVLRAVIDSVRTGERTILCATHELDVAARIADRVAIIADGRVRKHGTVEGVLGSDEVAEVPRALHDALAQAVAGEEVGSC